MYRFWMTALSDRISLNWQRQAVLKFPVCVSCSVFAVPYQVVDHDGAKKSLNSPIYCRQWCIGMYDTCFLKYPVCMTCLLCASSEQFASLLLILARYCSDACFITVIIKCSHDLLIRNLMRYCRMAFSVPLLSHKRGHLFATAAKGQNIIFFLKTPQ